MAGLCEGSNEPPGIMMMGIPTEIYLYGTLYWVGLISIFPLGVITDFFYLPVFYELQLTSTYELRFSPKLRVMASVLSTIGLILYIPIVTYVPALAFSQVSGLNIHIISPVILIICVFYTMLGGIKAVVWTDFLQGLVMMVSMVTTVTLGVINVGGFGVIWERSQLGGRIKIFDNLNSLGATLFEDFVRPCFKQKISDHRANVMIKCVVIVIGGICLAFVMVVDKLGAVLQLCLRMQGITYGAVIGIFSMGMFYPRANAKVCISHMSLPSKETLRGHSDSSFRGEGYIQCCVGVRLCDMYSNQELAEIRFMYGKADGNAALARRLYQERYPQRQCPDRKTFVRLHYRLCEYGKFNSPGLGRGRPRSTTPEVQEEILEAVNMTPSISTRRVRFSLNMWAGITGDRLVGPHVLVNRLTGQAYTNFLENTIPHVLEDTLLINRQHIHFLHDGAPAHFSRTADNIHNLLGSKGALTGSICSLLVMGWLVIGSQKEIAEGRIKDVTLPTSVDGCGFNVTMPEQPPSISSLEEDDVFILYRLSMLYYALTGTVIVFVVGIIVSHFTEEPSPEQSKPVLFTPLVRKYIVEKNRRKTAYNNHIPEMELLNKPWE
ncbi:hypothetical protein ANN_15532 [Periplaneta americana]|uniref:DUF4817 domain-containing protein n=1 Tax=Periplaneta americana TaxID=6978 RepID=A0ABQ8SGM3_PERAM|nr:hypothetical protein ANN_15532 [Periplaneta americana]